MTVDKNTPLGDIDISLNAISLIAGNATVECYGVVGLTDRNARTSLLEQIERILKADSYSKGVRVRKTSRGYEVDLYIIVAFGVKITEVVSEVQKKVMYDLNKILEIKFKAVNVFVHALKNLE